MIFIDSSAFYLIINKGERLHKIAKKTFNKIILDNDILVTSDYIIDETLTLVSRKWGKYYAIEFWDSIKNSDILKVMKLSERQFYKTIDLFRKYKDHDFSFTDCSCFIMMNDLKINKVFTFDKHFLSFGLDGYPKNFKK